MKRWQQLSFDDALTIVLGLFRQELDQSTIGPEDDFFDLGGDSLMATSLITAINAEFDCHYVVSNIMDTPTPVAFARELSDGKIPGDLVRSVPGCTGTEPMLYIHGGYGDNFQFRYFGEDMRRRWNIASIRAQGAIEGEVPHQTLDALVTDYITQIKNHFGGYPSVFTANCMGTFLGMEIAARMYRETGNRVTIVAIDPPGEFLEMAATDKPFEPGLFDKLGYAFHKALNAGLQKIGKGSTQLAAKARRKMIVFTISKLAKQAYPDAFPCNILIFTGRDHIDDALPSFQKWASKDTIIRGVPLDSRHRQLHAHNKEQIDRDIIGFIAEMQARNLYERVA